MTKRMWAAGIASLAIVGMSAAPVAASAPTDSQSVGQTWTEVLPHAPWSARAGLQAVEQRGDFFVMGGRVPNAPDPNGVPIPGDSTLLNDVWSSPDGGKTWRELRASGDTDDMWAPRAYFSAVTKGKYMYVLGGQDFNVTPNTCPPGVPGCPPFVSSSRFFNDVWRSKDGQTWTRMTASAPWEGRAGLSAAVLGGAIYVFGGSKNDDSSIIGGPPQREYFNDVWKSTDDGRTWLKAGDAPWAKRAGAATVVKGGAIYLLGGEVGFTCGPQPCELPYYNDVWRTRNGTTWTQVTAAAGWSKRPGHKCEVLQGWITCFGGFGVPTNPMDVWISQSGKDWKQLAGAPWNAASPDEIKYDFDTAVLPGCGGAPAIFTFGGDRETFDFADPTNYLRVDNDVWRVRLTRK